MINVLIFIIVSGIIVYAILFPLVSSNSSAGAFIHSKQAFMAGNSATEEVLYKLKNQMEVSSETISIGNATATINVANTSSGKTITVNGQSEDFERNIEMEVEEVVGVSFSYGLQSGEGGFEMAGGAGIYGNVYSNGDILGSGGPFITGSATVANGSDPSTDVSHIGTTPAPNVIDFGGNSTPQDAAQSFVAGTTTPITSIRFYMKKSTNNWMNNITVRLVNDSSGSPGKTTYASATQSASQVTTSFNYLTLPFTSQPALTSGTTYWIVFDTGTTWGSYYSLGGSQNSYAGGQAKTGTWSQGNGGTWGDTSPSGIDIYFETYAGGDTGLIDGITIGQSGGDAWAHEVNNSSVTGTIYCQASTNNNKACDTSRPDPVQSPLPISDGNIESWKEEAETGGVYNGDKSFDGSEVVYLGPQKIVGDLSVGSGAVLNVTGTLWVTGDISLSGEAKIKLSSSYSENSGVIVTDGNVSVTGGGVFEGSGTEGSYLLVVSTSSCPTIGCSNDSAIEVSGGTGAVVLNAQKGTIEFSGGAQAKQATAKKIVMTGGTSVHYETGLQDINFTSGPSGTWSVAGWREI